MKRKSKPAVSTKSAKSEVEAGRKQIAVAEYRHSGPIPDPMTLQRYDQIIPGAANRILLMAEEQATHRKEIEKIVIKSRSRDSLLGIISGFLLAFTTIVAGTLVMLKGQVWGGAVLGSAGLVGLVAVFIYGTNSNRKERESKSE